jgi:RimJ/RimL family protein N-acetyltransferase
MKTPFLVGQTIYLRPLERDDAPLAQAWVNDPDIRCFLRRQRPINLQAEEEFIAKLGQTEHDLGFMIVLRETDQPIGMMGLHNIDSRNRHAEFGITIGVKEYWGKGHGTEATRLMVQYAFGTLNLNRVCLLVYDDNVRGIRAYQKVGFQQEGVLRQENFHAGRYRDTIVMSILREEWES